MIVAENIFIFLLFMALVVFPGIILIYAYICSYRERMRMTPEERAVCDAFHERYWF